MAHVTPAPGMTPEHYVDLIDRRFPNPAIVDTTKRGVVDGSSCHPDFLLPTVRDVLETGGPAEGLALAEAVLARMCEGRARTAA